MKESVEDDVADTLLRDAGESVAVEDEEEDDSDAIDDTSDVDVEEPTSFPTSGAAGENNSVTFCAFWTPSEVKVLGTPNRIGGG